MALSPRTRRLAVFVHVTSSVGWLGAVAATVALAIAGASSTDPQTVRAAYPALEVIGWYALVPLSIASLASGLVVSLGGRWGVFEHYWVVTKLLINVAASGVLLLYMQTLDGLARTAASAADLEAVRSYSPVLHAGGALALLLAATVLSIYKPRGRTRYGWRKQRRRTSSV
ncbi:DUF2269 domain-containing protein [Patulibacter sp. NPDC049589]|uniref:DUF2269 domain-containing protein n=1 Tax=Patulibacter sp. NPDC049589 TaxID=3154731 RepID=UPI003419F45E